MLNYPANYQNIAENEMEYLNGGAPDFKGLFDYLIGNYARDLFMEICAVQFGTAPYRVPRNL